VFESSHQFEFFDYFRVPYGVSPGMNEGLPEHIGRLGPKTPNGRSVLWLRADRVGRGARLGRYRLGGSPVVGHVIREPPGPMLDTVGQGWHRTDAITNERGRRVASVWADTEGSVFLPFDPGEVMHNLWSERYATIGHAAVTRRLRGLMVRAYYLVRPMLPRQLQLRMRRAFARRQATPTFPAWPIEHGLHDLYRWLFATVTTVAGAPVPWLDTWPDGKAWAFVLTHDVETDVGFADIELLRAAERSHACRSSWNLVGERYIADPATVRGLHEEGCEIGVHGLRHDGRDLASRRLLQERLPAMRRHAARWGAVGFRSPATQRSWDLMPLLGFDYDTSYTDTDPYEPQPGGCCTYLPFFNRELVELPITLPQDHTLFEVLQHDDGRLWIEKTREIRDRGGMVLVLAHPDYARDGRLAAAWLGLLAEFANDDTVWQALPREVADWWRRRASSVLAHDDDGWMVVGPAADRGRICFTVPNSGAWRVASPVPAAAAGTRED
jgi:hypothetical protein